MVSIIAVLTKKSLAQPPKWLPANVQYETIVGSTAYGVTSNTSDMDIGGFCIPPKEMVFPHLAGEILGFGQQKKRFDQFQQHHIEDPNAMGGHGRVYDITIYSIVKFFQLCMENNPNMVDALFTPRECVLHSTQVGNLVRENRRIFLHKGCWHKFKGYAYSQLSRMETNPIGKRKEIIERWGFDIKSGYHTVRLLDEVEQILTTGDLDLRRAKEHMKAIRRGDVSLGEIKQYFSIKEKELEKAYADCTLPWGPDETKIRQLLLDCFEVHYGNLEKCVINPDKALTALRKVQEALDEFGSLRSSR